MKIAVIGVSKYSELLSHVIMLTQERLDSNYDGLSFELRFVESVFCAIDSIAHMTDALALRTLTSTDFLGNNSLGAERYSLRWLTDKAIKDRLMADAIEHLKSIYL